MTAVRIRPEEPGDAPGIRRVLVRAFARPRTLVPAEAELVEELRGSVAWLPELSMVAELDQAGSHAPGSHAPVSRPQGRTRGSDAFASSGELVGYALLSRVRVGPAASPALALGPVAVLPGRQRSGYGTAVVRAVLDAATEHGERLVVVLGAPRWYRRFGFRPAAELGLTSPWSGLGEPWQAPVLRPTAEGAEPLPTGEVHYPDPWGRV